MCCGCSSCVLAIIDFGMPGCSEITLIWYFVIEIPNSKEFNQETHLSSNWVDLTNYKDLYIIRNVTYLPASWTFKDQYKFQISRHNFQATHESYLLLWSTHQMFPWILNFTDRKTSPGCPGIGGTWQLPSLFICHEWKSEILQSVSNNKLVSQCCK